MAEALGPLPAQRAGSHLARTARNVLSNWGAYAFSIALNFLLAPFVVRHLGNSAYGAWVLILSLTGYLGLLDLGVRGAVTRYVAKFHTASQHEDASGVTSAALAIFTVAGGLAVSVSLLLAAFGLGLFRIPSAYYSAARWVLALGGLSVAASLIGGVFGGVLVGMQRFDIVKGLEVLSSGLRALAIVIVLKAGMGLIALACIQLAFALATCLAGLVISYKIYPQLRINFTECDRQNLALIFSYSIYSFLLQISNYVIYYTDAVVIGAFLPVAMITFFSIAENLVRYASQLINGVSQAISPLASALEAQNDSRELQQVTLGAGRLATLLALPLGLTFMLRGHTFIGLWMGREYAELAGKVLWILSLSMIFYAGNQVAFAVLFGIGKHKVMLPVTLAEAACNLALSVAWVRSQGVVGVAWGTTIPNLAASLLFWPWYLCRLFRMPARTYYSSIWVRPLLGLAPFALCTYAVEKLWAVQNMLFFFLQVGAVLPLAWLGAWYSCFTPAERRTYAQKCLLPLQRALGRN